MARVLPFLPILLGAGCSTAPEFYAPPPQRQPLLVPGSSSLSYFLSMSNPNANAYIVQGIAPDTEGTGYRWTYAHPVVRFWLPHMDRPKFHMDFAFPERVFRVTGPLTLSFSVNGKPFDRVTYPTPGQLQYEHEVPTEMLRWDAINLVAIDPDKLYNSPGDSTKLGFVVSRLGFLE